MVAISRPQSRREAAAREAALPQGYGVPNGRAFGRAASLDLKVFLEAIATTLQYFQPGALDKRLRPRGGHPGRIRLAGSGDQPGLELHQLPGGVVKKSVRSVVAEDNF